MSERPRVYSEQEASEIVKRAAELAEARSANSYKSGITREELERIASEMGVPIESLNQAIAETEGSTPARKPNLSFRPKLESVVDFEATEDDLASILDLVRPMRRHAVVLTNRRLELTTTVGLMQVRITAQARNGRTKITFDGFPIFAFLVTCYPMFIFGLTTTPHLMKVNPVAGVVLALAQMTVGVVGFFAALKFSQQKFQELAVKVKERLEESHQESTSLRDRLSNSAASTESSLEQNQQA